MTTSAIPLHFLLCRYNDGLDQWRLTAPELMKRFEEKGADAVYAFQTRNPTHAGHAYLMRSGRDILLNHGFKQPILWLSPLGGSFSATRVDLLTFMRRWLDEGR